MCGNIPKWPSKHKGLRRTIWTFRSHFWTVFSVFHAQGSHRGSSTEVASPFAKLWWPLAHCWWSESSQTWQASPATLRNLGLNERPVYRPLNSDTWVQSRPPSALKAGRGSQEGLFSSQIVSASGQGQPLFQRLRRARRSPDYCRWALSDSLLCWTNELGTSMSSMFRYDL